MLNPLHCSGFCKYWGINLYTIVSKGSDTHNSTQTVSYFNFKSRLSDLNGTSIFHAAAKMHNTTLRIKAVHELKCVYHLDL